MCVVYQLWDVRTSLRRLEHGYIAQVTTLSSNAMTLWRRGSLHVRATDGLATSPTVPPRTVSNH